MLIVGDLSGIHDYLFDIAHEGGGQARRFRARSFFIQTLAECIALRVRLSVGWEPGTLIFCGAGKFILNGPDINLVGRERLAQERVQIERWLLSKTSAQLRLAMASVDGDGTPLDQYERAMHALQEDKLRPWSGLGTSIGAWEPNSISLPPLDTPCAICRHAPAIVDEPDRDGGSGRRVCERCHLDGEVGRAIPNTKWLMVRPTPSEGDWNVAGFGVSLVKSETPFLDPIAIAIANLMEPDKPPLGWPQDKLLIRRLARHIPSNKDGRPLEFSEIAAMACGDSMLGVLMMDGDAIGVAINRQLSEAKNLDELGRFSNELDRFMSVTLDRELESPEWEAIYTIFAGGDDLLLVGPWDVMLNYAGHVREMFNKRFGTYGMTISAGLSLLKPRRPVRRAVIEAGEQLHRAKTEAAPGYSKPKDQIAALGQIWKWSDHKQIIMEGVRLANWVNQKTAQRGWLHTLLELSELGNFGTSVGNSTDRGRATARLAYQVSRNFPKQNDSMIEKRELRRWADEIVNNFDDRNQCKTIYLPAIVRYALVATRDKTKED